MRDLLEQVGLDKDEVETINEHQFRKSEHYPKINALFSKENTQTFSFSESDVNPEDEIETGIIVYDDSQEKYISAKIAKKDEVAT